MTIQPQQVQLGQKARGKSEAIAHVASLLEEQGFVKEGYHASMIKREETVSTYLDNAIAIPHGRYEEKHLVIKTGIVILQLKKPIIWNGKDKVSIVIGIAANSDEHVAVLEKLTSIVLDQKLARKLAKTNSKDDFVSALSTEHASGNTVGTLASHDVQSLVLVPKLEALHARPASTFVQIAKTFNADIEVLANDKVANAKSVPQVLNLAADRGSQLTIAATGKDASQAVQRLVEYIESDYDGKAQSSESTSETTPAQSYPTIKERSYQGKIFTLNVAREGITTGPIHYVSDSFDVGKVLDESSVSIENSDEEINRLNTAIERVSAKINEALNSSDKSSGYQDDIFSAHLMILTDEDLLNNVRNDINKLKIPALHAWWKHINNYIQQLEVHDNPLFAERSADYKDIGEQVLKALAGIDEVKQETPKDPYIVIASELSPSKTAALSKEPVLAIVFTRSSTTSHAAIIARSFGVPVLIGGGQALEGVIQQYQNKNVIVDAQCGLLVLDPSEEDLAITANAQEQFAQFTQLAKERVREAAHTKDGVCMQVKVNITSLAEHSKLADSGSDGIGLLRTEFLFLDRQTAPTVDEQQESYELLARSCKQGDVIIRTLDVGGDKKLPYVPMQEEMNPFLGLRGLRLCFHFPDLFNDQIRALFRAAKNYNNIKIMFPMVSNVEEFIKAKEFAEVIRKEENAPQVSMGIMIEVPSILFALQECSQLVDFFSIGTNDLMQYLFAVDRMTSYDSIRVNPLHPIVYRSLKYLVEQAGKTPIGICGSLGQNSQILPVLLGIGIDSISVPLPSVALMKEYIRMCNASDCKQLAEKVIKATSAEDTQILLNEYM